MTSYASDPPIGLCSYMLIKKNGISVRIHQAETGRTRGAFIRFRLDSYSLGFKLSLDLPGKHSLEQTNYAIGVFHNQPILRQITMPESRGLLTEKAPSFI